MVVASVPSAPDTDRPAEADLADERRHVGASTLRDPPGGHPGSGFSWTALAIILAAVALLAVLVLLVDPLNEAARSAISGDTKQLREQLRDLGVGGVLVLFVIVMGHAVIPYPSEIPLAAAGFVYGFWLALPISAVLWTISAMATWAMGRYAGRPLLYRIAGRERFTRAEQVIERGGVAVLLVARLVPIVPFSLTGYVAGAARVRAHTFAWCTVVGYLPLMVIITLLGSRLEALHPTDPVLWIALAPLLVLVGLAHPLAKRLRAPDDEPEQA